MASEMAYELHFVMWPSILLLVGVAVSAIVKSPSSTFAVDHVTRRAVRLSFVVGAFVALLSFGLTGPAFLTGPSFNIAAFLKMDTIGLKNMLHGCFVLGGISNYVHSGNPRYATLLMTVMAFIFMPAVLASVIAGVQLQVLSSQIGLQLFVPLAMAGLCCVCCGAVYIARRVSSRDASEAFPALRHQELPELGRRFVELRLGHSPQATQAFRRRRRRIQALIIVEAILLIGANVVLLGLRLSLAHLQAGPTAYPEFIKGFITAYTLAIHDGWLIGNGLHAASTCSLESLNLFMWAKAVFGTLKLAEALATAGQGLWLGTQALGGPWGFALSLGYSSCLALVQLCCLADIRALQFMLNSVGYQNDSQFVPAGPVLASGAGVSVLDLARMPDLPPRLRARARWAGRMALASAGLFQAECILMVWLDPTLDSILPAFNFGLHFAAIFMLTFYRSAQDYKTRLRKRTLSLQACVFGVYTLAPASQMLSVILAAWDPLNLLTFSGGAGPANPDWIASLAIVFGLSAAKVLVNGTAAVHFAGLRLPASSSSDSDNDTGAVARAHALGSPPSNQLMLQSFGISDHELSLRLESKSASERQPGVGGQDETQHLLLSDRAEIDRPGPVMNPHDEVIALSAIDRRERSYDPYVQLPPSSAAVAQASMAQLSLRERRFFTRADLALRGFLAAYAAFALALVISDAAAGDDLRGWFGVPFSSISTESRGTHVAFHFCFLLIGYSKRGYDTANIMFLHFASFASLSMAITLVTVCLAHLASWAFDLSLFAPMPAVWSGLLFCVFGATQFKALTLHALATMLQQHASLFPQNTHAMV